MSTPDIVPRADEEGNLGTPAKRWIDVVISGDLSDGTNAVSASEGKTAYDHSQTTSGNPHSVTAVEVSADAAGTSAAGIASHEGLYDHTKIRNANSINGVDLDLTAPSDGEVQVYRSSSGDYELESFNGLTTVTTDTTLGGDGTGGNALTVEDDQHDHTLSTVTDSGTAAALDVPALGDAASGEVVKGDDTRLTDDRDPNTHASTHVAGGTDVVDHDLLFNYVADEHVAHSSVTVAAGTGLTGGGLINGSIHISLADTAVTAGTYAMMTGNVDAQGRLIGASDGAIDPVFTGSMTESYDSLSASYTITDTDGYHHLYVTTGATDKTITLPTAADNAGRLFTIKKVDSAAGNVIVDGEGSETIDGATTANVSTQYDSMSLQCDGSNWHIL